MARSIPSPREDKVQSRPSPREDVAPPPDYPVPEVPTTPDSKSPDSNLAPVSKSPESRPTSRWRPVLTSGLEGPGKADDPVDDMSQPQPPPWDHPPSTSETKASEGRTAPVEDPDTPAIPGIPADLPIHLSQLSNAGPGHFTSVGASVHALGDNAIRDPQVLDTTLPITDPWKQDTNTLGVFRNLLTHGLLVNASAIPQLPFRLGAQTDGYILSLTRPASLASSLRAQASVISRPLTTPSPPPSPGPAAHDIPVLAGGIEEDLRGVGGGLLLDGQDGQGHQDDHIFHSMV